MSSVQPGLLQPVPPSGAFASTFSAPVFPTQAGLAEQQNGKRTGYEPPPFLRVSLLYVRTAQPLSTACDLFQEPHPHPASAPDSIDTQAVHVNGIAFTQHTETVHAKCACALIPATQEAEAKARPAGNTQ